MKIDLTYYKTDLVFQAKGSAGVPILLGQAADDSLLSTTRPMELLLMSLASCSSVDIVKILKTQNNPLMSIVWKYMPTDKKVEYLPYLTTST